MSYDDIVRKDYGQLTFGPEESIPPVEEREPTPPRTSLYEHKPTAPSKVKPTAVVIVSQKGLWMKCKSIGEAARKVGCTSTNMMRCCRNNKYQRCHNNEHEVKSWRCYFEEDKQWMDKIIVGDRPLVG